MKCNQSHPGFELMSPCPFPTTITITPWAPPNFEQIQEVEPQKTTTYLSFDHLFRKDKQNILGTARKTKMNSHVMFSHGHISTPVLPNKQKFTFICSIQTINALKRTWQEQWLTGIDGERFKGIHAVGMPWWWWWWWW